MKKEKLILSFIAIIGGLLVAGGGFFLYQSTKIVTPSITQKPSITPVQKEEPSNFFLSIDKPKDEEVVDTKTITISGKTTKDAVVVVSTNSDDQVFPPAKNGSFSTTQTINDGANVIEITAIAPNGIEKKESRIITYSNETF